jgi:hypothetical protein
VNAPRPLNSVVFDEIAAAIGSDGAHELCAHFGGTVLYVPEHMHADHRIAKAIGLDRAAQLAASFGRSELELPKPRRRRSRVLELHRRGDLTQGQIALATDYSQRHVRQIIAESRDDRQGDLFSGLPRK